VPSDEEWTELTDYLGGVEIAGGKLKEEGYNHWVAPNTGASNESEFTALPCGRYGNSGEFTTIYGIGYFWTSSLTQLENFYFQQSENQT